MMIGGSKVSTGAVTIAAFLLRPCFSFQVPNALETGSRGRFGAATTFLSSSVTEEPSSEISLDSEAIQLKDDLITLAAATRRGFSASRSDREKAKQIINNLAKYSPSDEPAAAYYKEGENSNTIDRSTIAGKWTLIYTDAPDITSLEGGPFSTAKLGRIGQECDPPMIKNVIEWQRPDWASSLPFSGGDSSRVLQKVCVVGTSTKENPKLVDLKLAGFELSGINDSDDNAVEGSTSFFNGPAGFLESNPVKLQGPLTAPFGKFEILYLDDGMRITKTFQGFFAVNIREENVWF
mmetsp:Transcript_3058/g.5619  ORF Transcript_3058/g.5619 Transcript_3058/m.5619 type:complete len:293 (+) Transcript_3058:108-986(+)